MWSYITSHFYNVPFFWKKKKIQFPLTTHLSKHQANEALVMSKPRLRHTSVPYPPSWTQAVNGSWRKTTQLRWADSITVHAGGQSQVSNSLSSILHIRHLKVLKFPQNIWPFPLPHLPILANKSGCYFTNKTETQTCSHLLLWNVYTWCNLPPPLLILLI